MGKQKPIESELKEGQVVEKFSKKNNETSGEIGPMIKRGL